MKLVLRTDSGGVSTLTLNDPNRLNVLSEGMLESLQSKFDAISNDQSVRCIVLRANGKAFCAGHDLRELTERRQASDGGRGYFQDVFNSCSNMMQTILNLPQPVIAEVHGVAAAAGCQLVATCDMAMASQNARFGVNGVNIGLFCSTPMVALSRNLPRKRVIEMLTTGGFLDADEAQRLGLINRIFDADDLAAETAAIAETVAGKLGAAVKIGKQAFYAQLQMSIEQAYAYTGQVMVENMLFRDTQEGIAAFLDKRPPDWQQ